MRTNDDIRETAKERGIRLYEIADSLGISEATFNRWMRKPLRDDIRTRVLAIIEEISNNK